MPFPLLALAPALVTWASRSLAVYGLAKLASDEPVQELKRVVLGFVIESAARYAGLELNEDDPLSDASFSNAVSLRVGFPIRSLRDKEMIREDLDNFAAGLVSERSGYLVRSVSNVALLKEDLLQIGCAELSGRLGIPVGVFPGAGQTFDAAAVRGQVLAWAKAELMTQINSEVMVSLSEVMGAGDLVAVAEQMNSALSDAGSIENVTARQLAVRIAGQLATSAVVDYNRLALGASKKTRRSESLRAAQAKFRRAHGNRQIYVPLGMMGTVT